MSQVIYLEAINRAMGADRETQHHLDVARRKGHPSAERLGEWDDAYDHFGRMLKKVRQALRQRRGSKGPDLLKEFESDYGMQPSSSEGAL